MWPETNESGWCVLFLQRPECGAVGKVQCVRADGMELCVPCWCRHLGLPEDSPSGAVVAALAGWGEVVS